MLASEFGLSEQDLRCHRQEHLHGFRAVPGENDPVILIDHLNQCLDAAEGLAERGHAKDDDRLCLPAISEHRKIIEIMARLNPSKFPPPYRLASSIPGWESTRQILIDALEEHPEAKVAVLCALDKVEYEG